MKRKVQQPVAAQGELVKYDQQGMPQLEVWLEDETIWLTQKQMAELFGCAPQNITYHLKSIFKIGELLETATCKDFLQVQIDGGRTFDQSNRLHSHAVLAGEAHADWLWTR